MSLTARLCLHLLGQAQDGVAQRIQGAQGLAVGGYDPGYPLQTPWAAPLGVVQPTRRRLAVHGTTQRVPQGIKGDILKMLRDLLGYARSRDSCNLLLLTGYLLDLTDL